MVSSPFKGLPLLIETACRLTGEKLSEGGGAERLDLRTSLSESLAHTEGGVCHRQKSTAMDVLEPGFASFVECFSRLGRQTSSGELLEQGTLGDCSRHALTYHWLISRACRENIPEALTRACGEFLAPNQKPGL